MKNKMITGALMAASIAVTAFSGTTAEAQVMTYPGYYQGISPFSESYNYLQYQNRYSRYGHGYYGSSYNRSPYRSRNYSSRYGRSSSYDRYDRYNDNDYYGSRRSSRHDGHYGITRHKYSGNIYYRHY